MAKAYYNEIDPYCAEWLNNLILEGEIAYGDVDTRSIEDVRPSDLAGYTQCHFFAGIGVWSHSLRLAGWPDDRPVWTGSCPCQPFSAAGKRGGTADERHLWPAWSWLIRQCKPNVVFGEQVASKDGRNWLDVVQTDLEGMGFAVGAGDICAAGVGAPHIRQRLYFVADSERHAGESGRVAIESAEGIGTTRTGSHAESGRRGMSRVMGHADDTGPQGRGVPSAIGGGHRASERFAGAPSSLDWLLADDTRDGRRDGRREERADIGRQPAGDRTQGRAAGLESSGVSSFWSACDWLPCIDGKARPVEPGTFPLAHGITGRVGRLRAYGNAIVAPCAKEFIKAYLDARQV